MNRSDFLSQISEVKQMIQNIGGTIQSEIAAEPASRKVVVNVSKSF